MTTTPKDFYDYMKDAYTPTDLVKRKVYDAFKAVTDWTVSFEFVPHQYYRGIEIDMNIDGLEHCHRVWGTATDENIPLAEAYTKTPADLDICGYILVILDSNEANSKVIFPYWYSVTIDADNRSTRLVDAGQCAKNSDMSSPLNKIATENYYYDCLCDYQNGVYIDSPELSYLLDRYDLELDELDLDIHKAVSENNPRFDNGLDIFIENNLYDYIGADDIRDAIKDGTPSLEDVKEYEKHFKANKAYYSR